MRLINEDAVLEIIERVTNEAVEKKQPKYLIQPRIIAEIAGLPTIEAKPDNGWISVKDKMPDECQEVLIYCPEFLEEIRKAFYTEGDFYVEKEDLIVKPAPNGYCTHWRYLPKPPKGV